MGCVGSTLAWLAIFVPGSRSPRLQQRPLVRGTGAHAPTSPAAGQEGQREHRRGSLAAAAVVLGLLCCTAIEPPDA
jgi:hypothetical protein